MREVSILRSIRKIYQFFVDKPVKKGTVLNNRYTVSRVIGTGSYGMVYHTKDLETKENRVVKQLRPSKRRNKKEVNLFENEIAVIRKLKHNNMPKLYDNFSTDGNFFYVMSLIEGGNLEDLIFLHSKTFDEKASLLMLPQLIEMVDYLHKIDVYHLDLRIPNILLKDKELFLIDFGLAKQAGLAPSSNAPIKEMKQQDYYDIGDILLYLLYTTYSSNNKKALPWTEELSLEKETVHLLKRLLRIDKPYSNISEISADLDAALKANEK